MVQKMIAKNMLRTYDLKEVFSDFFRIWISMYTKRLQQIEMPDLLYVCA